MKNVVMAISILFLFCTGCATLSSSMVATNNISSPVMVGPIANIKGEKHSRQGKSSSFSESSTSSYTHTEGDGYSSTRTQREGAGIFDIALKEAGADDPKSTVVVDKIKVGSSLWFFISGMKDKSWTGMTGKVYK